MASVAIFEDLRDAGTLATTPDFSLAAKHVLITGGTGDIGNAFAEAFLNNGTHVIIADIKAPKKGVDQRIRS